MPGIFISYRRSDDSLKYARDLAKKLSDTFGSNLVFRDITGIKPGEKFGDVLRKRLRSCSIMLVVIGRRWLSEPGPAGQPNRLFDPGDWVRTEIATAIGRDETVLIPLLVSGAALPSDDQLPGELKALLDSQVFRLDEDTHWEADTDRLIDCLISTYRLKPRISVKGATDGQSGAQANDDESGRGHRTTRSDEASASRAYSQSDCAGRWRLTVDGDLVEIELNRDGSWTATASSESRWIPTLTSWQGEWSVKNNFLRITQTRFGVLMASGPLRNGSSTWVAAKIRRITDERIVLADGTSLIAL